MVTTRSLRDFAADCLAWALKEDDPGQKDHFVSAARSWAATADAIDRFVDDGRGEAMDDLKQKLNESALVGGLVIFVCISQR